MRAPPSHIGKRSIISTYEYQCPAVRMPITAQRPSRAVERRQVHGQTTGPEILRRLSQLRQNASIPKQGGPGFSPGSANRCDQFTRHPGRTSSPLRPRFSCRYTPGAGARPDHPINGHKCGPSRDFQIRTSMISVVWAASFKMTGRSPECSQSRSPFSEPRPQMTPCSQAIFPRPAAS
jgi:hypothetical protein